MTNNNIYVAVPCRNRRLFRRLFDCIAAFEVPYRWTSIKGGAHMRFVDSWNVHASTKRVWAPPLTEVRQYGALNTAMQSKYAME